VNVSSLEQNEQPKRKGWSKPGPGRPKGLKNKTTVRKDQIVKSVLSQPGQKLPLQIFVEVMNGSENYTPLQLKAAELAAPYIHPKLVAMKVAPLDPLKDAQTQDALERGIDHADPAQAARLYAEYMSAPLTKAGHQATLTLDGEVEEMEG
jgi:hypothetical protein